MVYQAEDVFEASPELWLFLQSDSPGTFERVEEKAKEVAAPPVDKAVKSPPRSKATRRRRSKTDEES
jgi:hypothetical protein